MKNIHEDLKIQNISEAVLLMKAARYDSMYVLYFFTLS